MKTLTLSTLILFFLSIVSTAVHAQNVTIPDANFKAYLVGNTTINTNGDTVIQVSEANAFSGIINCSFRSISDLTGIEAFINITGLYCSNNQLTNLGVATNTALTELSCNNNQLTNLGVATNTALTYLSCGHNQLTNLGVATNTALTELSCNNNQLTNLDVANGNNTNISSSGFFNAANNPNLSCIQVDDVVYSTTNWTNIDSTTSFSTLCTPVSINKLEKETLKNVQVYPNPTSKNVSINLNKNYKEITILVNNTIGQVVFSKQYTAQQFINLDLEGNSGVYFVTILTEEGTSKTKVIKA